MSLTTCPECAKEFDDAGRYCPVCGYDTAPVDSDSQEGAVEDLPAGDQAQPARQPVSPGKRPDLLGLIEDAADWNAIFLFLIFAFLLLTFFA